MLRVAGIPAWGAYRRSGVSTRLALGASVLALAILLVVLVALSVGPVSIPSRSVASALIGFFGIDVGNVSRTHELVIQQIRLPRIVVAATVGMGLGVAGATMQGLFRNPLADPGIIGVSAGGALGAVIAIATGAAGLFFMALPLAAFGGAMLATLVVYGISTMSGHFSMATLLLAGIAVNAFLGAIVSAIIILVPDNGALREILFWLAGSLDSRAWEHVLMSLPPILAGIAIAMVMARDLNLLMLGDDEARSLGVNVVPVRLLLLAVGAMVTGVAVAVSGTIAFVGLVTPHVLRLLLGPDNRVLIPMSALGGAVFVILADTVARTVIQPAELRVGILTAFVGAPFFILLLIQNRGRGYAL